jgi:hypothetical protein
MVTADDDSVTDIVVEGDKEELERLSRVSCLALGGRAASVATQATLGGVYDIAPLFARSPLHSCLLCLS